MSRQIQRRTIMFRVEVVSLGVDHKERSPILILRRAGSEDVFPLSLTHPDAATVALVLKGGGEKGFSIHHTFSNFIKLAGYKVLRAELRSLNGNDRARLVFGSDLEDKIPMEVSPGDAIAMALCANASIFIATGAVHPRPPGKVHIMDQSAEGEKWTDILEKLDVDRFGHA